MDMGLIYRFMVPAGFGLAFYMLFVRKPAYNSPKGLSTKLARQNERSWMAVQWASGLLCGIFCLLTFAVKLVLTLAIGWEDHLAFGIGFGVEGVCLVLLLPLTNVVARKRLRKK